VTALRILTEGEIVVILSDRINLDYYNLGLKLFIIINVILLCVLKKDQSLVENMTNWQ
jgi:hypothetical protein